MVAMLSKPKKMPGDSFNISAFGCVTGQKLAKIKGSVCFDCYAMKGAYPWPVVQNAMQARLDFLDSANFAVDMAALLNKSRKDTMRWFDSGDVRSVAHCLKIIAVCRLTPNKKHWIPTKERKFWQEALKIEALPDNAVVRYSATMIDDTPPEDWEHSSAVITGYTAPVGKMCEAYRTKKNGEMISHDEYKTAKKEKQLGKIDLGYCGNCRACWSRQVKTVSYPKHQEQKTMAKFKVTFTLERDDELKEHDETFFDRQHIADEIQSWLQDLDFTFPDGIQIQVDK